jgi:hypothetical protein
LHNVASKHWPLGFTKLGSGGNPIRIEHRRQRQN